MTEISENAIDQAFTDAYNKANPEPPEEVADAPAEEATPEAETPTADPDSGDAAEAPALIFGKYKTLEDAEKAYKGLEDRFRNPPPPEPEFEEDEWEDPFAGLPADVDPHIAQRVAQLMERNSVEAAQWALSNPELLGDEYTQKVVDYAWMTQPTQTARLMMQYEMQQAREEMQAQWSQQIQPIQQHTQQQMVDTAEAIVRSQNAEYDAYRDKIGAELAKAYAGESRLRVSAADLQGPQQMAQLVQTIYRQIKADEYWEAQASQVNTPEPQPQRVPRASVQTRNSAAAPSGREVSDDDIRAAILAEAGITPA